MLLVWEVSFDLSNTYTKQEAKGLKIDLYLAGIESFGHNADKGYIDGSYNQVI